MKTDNLTQVFASEIEANEYAVALRVDLSVADIEVVQLSTGQWAVNYTKQKEEE